MQSSFVSSDFTDKLLNFKNISPANDVIASLMDTTVRHEETSSQTSSLYTVPITVIHEITFNERVSSLEKDVSQLKQDDKSAQHLEQIKSQILAIEAKAEQDRFIDIINKLIKYVIQEEIKSQLPMILPDFVTPMIQSTIAESFENKILLDKMQHSKSYLGAPKHRDLYDSLTKSYKLDKDLFESYGKPCSLKKDREDKDKEEDPSSAHAEEPSHTVDDSGAQQNQEFDTGNNDDQPAVEAALRDTWFKQPERPPTSNPKWNKSKHVDFRPPQTWISDTSRADKPRTSFDELMDTPIDFSAFIINQLNIINLTQKILVRQAFNLLKGTYKSHTELEYHFKECFKTTTDRLDWNNPEGQEYPFDLSKPLPLVEDYRGRQVVPVNYFINNDLKYLKGGSSSRTYTTSTIKTKAANYDISWIEDMVPSL
ncbi:hypothetical protein Tco_1568583 [Tanacetum coccineum]